MTSDVTDWRVVAANDILGYADLMAQIIADHGVDRAIVLMNQTLERMDMDAETARAKFVVALWQLVVANTDIPGLDDEDQPDDDLGPDDEDYIEPEPGLWTRMWRGLWS